MPKMSSVVGTTVVLAATLVGCAKEVKPTGPVLTPFERSRDFSRTDLAPARYATAIAPLTAAPVLPFLGYGMTFDVDVVLGPKSDKLSQIEVARTQTVDGPMWLVIESEAGTHEQTVLAALDDPNTWMPELPLARFNTNLVVQDKTTTDGIDLSVKYDNADRMPVEMTLQGQPAERAARLRNGNPMDHSANVLLAVRDVSSAESLFKADVRIDDDRLGMRKLGGFVPYQFTVTQSIGGIATGEFFQEPVGEAVPFTRGAASGEAMVWTPAAPPPAPPVIPPPMNPAEGEVVLLPMAEWTPLAQDVQDALLASQESTVDACLVAGKAANPDYAGVVAVDLHVKDGRTWEVTVDADSTGDQLVMTCAQTVVSAWVFEDTEADGSMRLMVGELPADHEAANALEQAWLDMKAPADGGAAPEGGAAGGEELPDDGDDLLGEGMDDAPAADEVTTARPLSHFNTVHTMPDGTQIAQPWNVSRKGDRVWVSQSSKARTLKYEYLIHGDDSTLELRSIQVIPWGQSVPATAITFSPALPDLRRPFNGKVESKFVIDVGGQANHATGTAVSTFGDAGARVVLTPSEPAWAAARPIVTTVNFKDGMPHVSTRRQD